MTEALANIIVVIILQYINKLSINTLPTLNSNNVIYELYPKQQKVDYSWRLDSNWEMVQ